MTIEKTADFPLPPELAKTLTETLIQCEPLQLAWLSGYCWAQAQSRTTGASAVSHDSTIVANETLKLTIISASQTGNARKVAGQLQAKLTANGVEVQLIAAGDYKPKNLADENIVLFNTSTQGDGEPPEEAVSLY